jgi:hypothetical protein
MEALDRGESHAAARRNEEVERAQVHRTAPDCHVVHGGGWAMCTRLVMASVGNVGSIDVPFALAAGLTDHYHSHLRCCNIARHFESLARSRMDRCVLAQKEEMTVDDHQNEPMPKTWLGGGVGASSTSAKTLGYRRSSLLDVMIAVDVNAGCSADIQLQDTVVDKAVLAFPDSPVALIQD